MPNPISMCSHCRVLDCNLSDEAPYSCPIAGWRGHEWQVLDGTIELLKTAAPGLLATLTALLDRVEKLERRFDAHEENHASKDYGSEYSC